MELNWILTSFEQIFNSKIKFAITWVHLAKELNHAEQWFHGLVYSKWFVKQSFPNIRSHWDIAAKFVDNLFKILNWTWTFLAALCFLRNTKKCCAMKRSIILFYFIFFLLERVTSENCWNQTKLCIQPIIYQALFSGQYNIQVF